MRKVFILLFVVFNFTEFQAQITFTDVTETAGIAFNGLTVESLAWGDYDNDGDQDLFLSTNALNKLMRNDGNDVFTDVSSQVGLTESFNNAGCAFGDLDNDGDLDLFVVSFGNTEPDFLYENLGATSNFTFNNVSNTTSNISNLTSVRGVALLDYNRDGLLDIYINALGKDILYKNLGNLQFQEVSSSVGINADDTEVGSVPTDINNDGWIDIFTGNRSSVSNKLFLNNGAGSFTDISVSAGIDKIGFGMGVLSFDYDNDLDMDLYWTTWPGNETILKDNALYQNQGNTTFINKTSETNTADTTGWGISCNAGDIDNDRFEDFFVSNGFSGSSTQSILFRNNNGIDFQDITNITFGNITWDARGVAFSDYDNDGDLDICLTGGVNADTKLWRNDTNNSNNWVTLKLKGTTSNKSAIGSRIEVTANGITTVKEVSGGAGRGSFNSLPVEFGLGTATTISNVKIRWPNGNIENFNNININQINSINEGDSTLAIDDTHNLDTFKVKAYPNPFKKTITIDLNQLDTIDNIKIYNTLGQIIYQNNELQKGKIEVEIKNNYKGLLYLIIESNNKKIMRKIIKY